ncbi:NUDIX hydrolase [Roseobacter sinensis]|uniref:NUDIX hydrolase n=1 Tax=Roseobacter sinensis TaxID=2931391 RepID=A0ABT3BJD1_9RHOB|nr:NUDIX hydrolase [Roseobacter sp. WL0113]MCV3273672.1 NUDIX hydrolase [Roseobacter sp. WL0113]
MTIAPKLAALAVLLREEHVLLVQRRNPPDAGLWGFPGGHVEPGETALAAASRELLEETGVTAQPLRYLTNIDVIRHDHDGVLQFHFLLAAVLCAYDRGEAQARDDADAAQWHPVTSVLAGQLACSRHVDDVLRCALEA